MSAKDDAPIVVTEPGVLAFGSGLPTGSNLWSSFRDETVVQVSCGSHNSAVVCESGRVYIFRANQHNCAEPTLVDSLGAVRVTQAECGVAFIVYLTDVGDVYVCEWNYMEQLNPGHFVNVPEAVLVTNLPPIKKIAAHDFYIVVLAENGDVWACSDGIGHYGQLGIDHRNPKISFNRVPDLPEPIIDISCGAYNIALITASRVLYMAGSNDCGRLGLSTDTGVSSSFKAVSLPSTAVAAVSCGNHHTVALGFDGTIWAWGSNHNGQLGIGNTINRFSPTKVIGFENQSVSRVIAGVENTAVLTHQGDVFMCGSGKYGQLGLRNQNFSTPTLLPKSPELMVQQVAFASTYSLVSVALRVEPTSKPQIGITEQGDRPNHCPTDIERNLMRGLECPVCLKIMCAPIHMCVKGHSLCGSCRSDNNMTVCPLCREQLSAGRNITLESLCELMVLPCVECLQRMPASLLEKHGRVCPARKYGCPVAPVSSRCIWAGRADTILAHAAAAHPDRAWTNLPHVFLHSTSDSLLRTDLLAAHGQVFTLHRLYDDQGFRAAVRYIGQPDNRHGFKFELSFITDDISNTYVRNVSADIANVEDVFLLPSHCVSLRKETVISFVQQSHLVCQVTIVKVESDYLSDQVKALLSGLMIQSSPR